MILTNVINNTMNLWTLIFIACIATAMLSFFACWGHDDNTKKNTAKVANNIDDTQLNQIIQNADFIVNGYAFTAENNQIRILNLNNTDKSTVTDKNGCVLMTSMDDIEISIVQKYLQRNKEFLRQ